MFRLQINIFENCSVNINQQSSLTSVCNNARSYVILNCHLRDGLEMELKQFLQCVWGLHLKDSQSESTAVKSLLVIALVLIDLDNIKMC